jgi:D-beta-D-heptose 7-phosphate kinase / D-beta-D-heptose 1-phosphate adenosyltransferase
VSGPSRPRVAVVGDALLDVDWTGTVERVCPDAPAPVLEHHTDVHRPGGAALAARFAAEAGAAVTLVTALGDDDAGAIVCHELAAVGVTVVDLGLAGPTPVKLRLRAAGQSLARVDRACTPVLPPGAWGDAATGALTAADAVLVSDYGRGLAAVPAFGALLPGLSETVPVIWDPHVRGPRPPEGLDLLVPNLAEAAHLAGDGSPGGSDPGALASLLASHFACAVALTAGQFGAVLARPGEDPVTVPVPRVAGDPCGAGDRFAATLAVERARRAPLHAAAQPSVAAARTQVAAGAPCGLTAARARLVPGGAERPADLPVPRPAEPVRVLPTAPGDDVTGSTGRGNDPVAVTAVVRAAGGTVVATGGCFDVLHAGHVRLLEAARRLGDCLVVCLNGDLSVRRLKGRHRPVNPVDDRRAVLAGLSCVDAVVVFDEDTPCAVLRQLRPHLFVKGADYAGGDIPERDVLARWGGQVVFVPLVSNRSTTRILQAAAAGAGVPAG